MNVHLKYTLYWFGSIGVIAILRWGTGSDAVWVLVPPVMATLVYGLIKELH